MTGDRGGGEGRGGGVGGEGQLTREDMRGCEFGSGRATVSLREEEHHHGAHNGVVH